MAVAEKPDRPSMAKQTKSLSGPAKRKFLRGILHAEPGLEPGVAERLADRLDAEISQLRARRHVSLQAPAATPEVAGGAVAEAPDEPAEAADAAPSPPPFDPHSFSLIVVMTRQGAKGLMDRLAAIESAEDLRQLARAQHVAIEAELETAGELRQAIVEGTAQRIADRRAAAS
jgi:hypothetical protein